MLHHDINVYRVCVCCPFIAAVNGTGHFSAVCWLFARNMYDKFKIPIGLVASYWGGTPIQAWSSPDALKMCPSNEG